MATEASIRQRIYNYVTGLYPTDRPFETTLTGSYTTGTTIAVVDGTDWAEGDILENATTGELMRVISVSSNNLTVSRAYGGSTQANSTGTDDLLRKNPRWSRTEVDNAITESLNALSDWGIHGFSTGSITLAASQYYYELSDTDIDETYGVLAVYYVEDTTKQPIYLPFRQDYTLDTTDADWSQGRGITLLSKGDRATTDSVYYTYAQSYHYDTNNNTTLGKLLTEHEELVVLGAVTRLLGHTVLPYTQDPGARTDRTVASGQLARDGRWFQGEYYIKIRSAASRLVVMRQRFSGLPRIRRAGRWRG